jgi:hypothetical protein
LVTLTSPDQSISRGDNEPFTSPLFREAMTMFDRATRHVIFEPGSISPGILALLQGRRCRLEVADAALALSRLSGTSEDTRTLSQKVAPLVSDSRREKIDIVLCWDLLNYLSLPLYNAFTAHLAALMGPRGILHAYIHSAQTDMPQHPQRYAVLGNDLVVRLDRDPPVRKTPRYSYTDLDKHAGGLRVARSMLLRNGIQEYLLCMSPTKTKGDSQSIPTG